jgi:hypothetical protein
VYFTASTPNVLEGTENNQGKFNRDSRIPGGLRNMAFSKTEQDWKSLNHNIQLQDVKLMLKKQLANIYSDNIL